MSSTGSMHLWRDRHGRDIDVQRADATQDDALALRAFDEVLPSEDIAVLSVFLEQPTGPMTDLLLSARTLLPLSIVTDRVHRLVDAGLLREGVDERGRVTYDLSGRAGRARRPKKHVLR